MTSWSDVPSTPRALGAASAGPPSLLARWLAGLRPGVGEGASLVLLGADEGPNAISKVPNSNAGGAGGWAKGVRFVGETGHRPLAARTARRRLTP
jgi:hypothetical protein